MTRKPSSLGADLVGKAKPAKRSATPAPARSGVNETIAFTYRISPERHEELRRLAFEERTTIVAIVDEAVADYLARKGKRK